MKSFKEHLTEVAIQFRGKAYPKFGTVVIISGGAGSGKGFVLSNLLSIEGKVFDVDELKRLAIASTTFAAKVKEKTGVDLKKLDLRQADDVGKVHQIIGDIFKLDKKLFSTTVKNVLRAPADRKPNLIFDVTLKDMSKLQSITASLQEMGYDKKNIHVVWVMNEFNIAVEQNAGRARVVPSEVLLTTHEGAALTFAKILSMGDKLKKYMDGDIFIAFNKAKADSEFIKSDKGGSYINKANYIQVKWAGKTQTPLEKLGVDILKKIKSYVPTTIVWK